MKTKKTKVDGYLKLGNPRKKKDRGMGVSKSVTRFMSEGNDTGSKKLAKQTNTSLSPLYELDETSQNKLKTCHEDIRKLFIAVSSLYPIVVVCGHRGESAQNEAYSKGFSKLKYPQSKHNKLPSQAIDIVPIPNGTIDWNGLENFYHMAGYVMCMSHLLDIDIRWGGDWDDDKSFKDNKFNDLAHFELVGYE